MDSAPRVMDDESMQYPIWIPAFAGMTENVHTTYGVVNAETTWGRP